jgi:DNA-binding transcriptional LysR family regulator
LGAARGQPGRGVVYVSLGSPTVMAPLAVAWREDDASPALRHFLEDVERGRNRDGDRMTGNG